MSIMALIVIVLLTLSLFVFLTRSNVFKSKAGNRIQLFGIQVTLVGGIIAIDPNSSLGGIEYIIVLIGLTISIIGFLRE